MLEVPADGKNNLVRELASGQGRTVLFTRTKHAAKKLAKQLTAAGVPAGGVRGRSPSNSVSARSFGRYGASMQPSYQVMFTGGIAPRAGNSNLITERLG